MCSALLECPCLAEQEHMTLKKCDTHTALIFMGTGLWHAVNEFDFVGIHTSFDARTRTAP